MKLGRLTLTLAIAGIAAHMFLKKRDGAATAHTDFVDTEDSGHEDDAEMTPAGDMASDVTAASVVSGAGRESFNPAERLQAEAPTRLAEAIEGTSDDLFDSNSQSGAHPKTPGLPDLTRGA